MSVEALFFIGLLVTVAVGLFVWLWQLLREDDPVISQADRDAIEKERQAFDDRRRARLDVAARMKGKS